MKSTPRENAVDPVAGLLSAALADPGTTWSLGSFGALGEFMRDPDEAVDEALLPLTLATERGAIRLVPGPDLRPLAYETSVGSGWNHAIALCLPAERCAMGRRTVVTELGPDRDAIRPEHRDGILFDLGLGLLAVDACVRVTDSVTLAALRTGCGRPLFGSDSTVVQHLTGMSPHRVFLTRCGRIEVFAPIPPAGEASPEGPHTHIVPQLLRAGRTHAATTPIPAGLVPVGALHPAHPYKDTMGRPVPFQRERHDAFQALLAQWGDPDLVGLKRRLLSGATPGPIDGTRHRAQVRRVVAAQASYLSDAGIAPALPRREGSTEREG